MNLQNLLYRFRWLHTPAGILMLLLQRTPVLRVLVSESPGFGLQSGEVLKSAFALAALGAYNSVAGATVFNATATSPTTVTPASGGANTTFTSTVAANGTFSLAINGTGAPSTIRSWKVIGTLPTGISVTGGTAVTGGFVFNGLKVTLAGTPTVAGNQTISVRAYDSLNAAGNNAGVTCIVSVTGGAAPTPQTITFGALAGKTFGAAPFTVSAIASSGLTPTFSIFSGPATIAGSTVTLTGAGTVVVRASQAGNATYATAPPVDQSFSVSQATQTIIFGALTGKTFGAAPFAVSATASSGLAPTFTIFSGPATISGNTVTITGAGTVVVRASQLGNANYAAAPPVDQSFSVAQATQTITFGALTGKTFGDAAFTVSATATSGLAPTFSIFSGPATITGNTVTLTGAGTVVVRASQSGNTNYAAATPVDQSFSVGLTAQTITFGALTGKTFGDAAFTVSASASSGLTPTFTIFSGPATITGNTVTITGAGTVVVRASQSGNGSFAAATPVDQSFSVAQAAQTITFGALASKATGDAPFAVNATASSGLAPTFLIVSGPATIAGNTITLTGAGTVIVRASQSGNANFAAATSVDQSFTVGLTAQTITFGALTGKTFGDAAFTVSASASSGLTPTFTIFSGPATITGNTVTLTGAGTVVVRASQSGNASFAAATPVDQSFSVAQAAQTITFGALSGKTFGDAAFTVSATASSGLAPTFSIFSGSATISGNTVTLTGVGTVVVRASQLGNANYAAATPVDQSFSVAQATQTISFGALTGKTFGAAPFTVSATASSGLAPTFTIFSGPATITGNTVTLTGAGTVVVRAAQAGNGNYAAATPVDQSFAVAQAAQTISFGALSSKATGDAPFTVSATATSGLAPTFTIFSGPATISGNTVTLTGVGTVVVRAAQAGNTNYAAATPVDQSFTVGLTSQTITFGALTGKTFGDAAFTVSASATSGLTPTFTIFSGPATISGNTVTITGAGTVVVRASQAGNASFAAATPVDQSFSVAQAAQTITFGALSGKTFGDAAFTVSASATSGLTPTFTIFSGPATISGNTVTLTGAGIVVVRASQSGNANFTAATPVNQSFSVAQATQTITSGTLTGKTFGDAAFTVSATASSGLAPTFTIFSGPATISGNTVTITGVGIVVVRASQSGNANYAAATPVDQSFSVAQATQTITFGTLTGKTFGDAAFTVSASATSGLTPAFTIFSGPATISSNTVTLTGVGTVVVRAAQAGNANYAAATPVDQSFSVAQATQTITFGALPNKATGDAPFTVSATSSSGLAPTFAIFSGPATISGNIVTLTGPGTVVVRASQAGNTNYTAATPVDQSFSVGLTSQTITFGALSGKTFGTAPFTVGATATSGLTPTYSIFSGPATISGNIVTLTGVGTVVVRASQSGNATYAAATPVDQSFSVSKGTATVTLGSLSQSYTGSPLSASAVTVPDGLAVTYTYNASSTAPTYAGSYTVVATINDALYQGSTTGTLVISPLAQTITFGALSAKTFGDAAFTVSASASSILAPTFSIFSGPATISGNTITLTGGGIVVVRAAQAGNTNYAAATPVDQSFSVNAAPVFTTQPVSQSAVVGGNVTFTATASGVPAPTLQWYQGTTLLNGQTGSALTLSNVQDTAAGSYTAVATNSSAPAGVTSFAATLTVNAAPTTPVAPVITQQPKSSTVAYIGDTVILSVVATGNPAPTYQWMRGRGILSGQTNSTLVFNSARLDDSDTYSVIVTNSAAPKGVTSRTAKLSVLLTPPALVVAPAALCIGERLTLDLSGGATYPAGVTFSTSRLPDGLRLDALTGHIDGILTGRPGNYAITYWTKLGRTQSTPRTLRFTVATFPAALTGGFETLLDAATTDLAAPAFPAGKLELNVTSNGTFIGRLWTDDVPSYPIRGTLLLAGDHAVASTTISVARSPFDQMPDYQLTLSVDRTGLITAALSSNAIPVGAGSGSKLVSRVSPANYTMILRNPVNLAASALELPAGDGYFTVSCSATGVFTLKGRVGDGTALTATTALGADGMLRLYAKPYSAAAGGYLAGTLALTPRSDLPSLRHITVAGGSDLYWRKPAIAGDKRFAAGFGPLALEATMEPWLGSGRSSIASRLSLPSTGNFVVDINGPALTGEAAAFVESLPVTLNLNPRNVFSVIGANPTGWKLQLDANTGRFYGTCRSTGEEDKQSFTIEGAMVQAAPGDTLIGGGSLLPVPHSEDDEKKSTLLNAVEFTRP